MEVYTKIKDNIKCEAEEDNNYYSESFAEIVLKKYAAYAPLWTNLMGTFVEPDRDLTTISNAPAEGYFSIMKNVTLDGARDVRATEYIRPAKIYVDARLAEVNDLYLTDVNNNVQIKAKNVKLEEDQWRRTPKKVKDKFNKNIIWEKVAKIFKTIPRPLKQKRYVLLKFENVFAHLRNNLSYSPTIDINEFKSLDAKQQLYNNVVDIYIGITIHTTHIQKGFSTSCEERNYFFYGTHDMVIPLAAYEYIFIPILHSMHFTLVVLNTIQKSFTYINPLGEEQTECHRMLTIFESKAKTNMWTLANITHKRQYDNFNCGVYICQFVEAILNNGNLDCLENPNKYREIIKEKLIEFSDSMQFICLHCGDGPKKYTHTCTNCERPSCEGCLTHNYGTNISCESFKCIFCNTHSNVRM